MLPRTNGMKNRWWKLPESSAEFLAPNYPKCSPRLVNSEMNCFLLFYLDFYSLFLGFLCFKIIFIKIPFNLVHESHFLEYFQKLMVN